MTDTAAAEALRARSSVGLAGPPDAVLRVTGADRVAFLHRMVTCDVKGIPAGGTARGLFLTPKGKVLAEFLLAVLPDRVEMIAPSAAGPALRSGLAKYLVADDAAIEDRTGAARVLSLVGPGADAAVPAAAAAGGALLLRRTRAGLPAVDLLVDAAGGPGLVAALQQAARAAGGGSLGEEALEILRVENGVPALGAEATEETLPRECGLEELVSFTKGCFLGQEPVARLRTRGHTNRGLAGLLLDPGAPLPARGDAVLAGEKEAGHATSAVLSPSLGRPVALALLRHEHAAPGTVLLLRTAQGPVSCVVAGLPFVR